MKRKQIHWLLLFLLFGVTGNCTHAAGGTKTYNSYKGLVMAGYQGWFNTPGDGAGRQWHHYTGPNGFRPGSCTIDLWPDVSEYEKTYPTEFRLPDGTPARVFSSYDASTVDTHFRWMQEYGLDGVFMQRFLAEIRNPSGLNHFNKVLDSAMQAANKYERAICIMYDLSGMNPGDEQLLLKDIAELAERHSLKDHHRNPSYLYHNGKPLVCVWGVGFNDHRRYGFDEATTIIKGLQTQGFSIMLGVPTHWQELDHDTLKNPRLHQLIRQCDVVMPWFVGRYDETSFPRYHALIQSNIRWARENGIDYAPLCFPGFSWRNMPGHEKSNQIPRNQGQFFWQQLSFQLAAGAEMLYIAMFDEIDEGTAIFKCAHQVPVGGRGSTFVAMEEGVGTDHYLWLAGQAGKMLKGEIPLSREMPVRTGNEPSLSLSEKTPVDYVNPYIGNISHLLVPTFPTIHLPGSLLRVYPERADYTGELLHGLPVAVTHHRERSAFNLSPCQGDTLQPVCTYTYDNEHLRPYAYDVDISPADDADNLLHASYAPSHQSAIYQIEFQAARPAYLVVNSRDGCIRTQGSSISGYQTLSDNTRLYLYIESEQTPVACGIVSDGHLCEHTHQAEGRDVCAAWRFADHTGTVRVRYGISLISEAQARANLRRELTPYGYDVARLQQAGRDVWNQALGRITVEGGTDDERTVFYTSLYRTFERPICISEDGHYFSASDGRVHPDEGTPFYTDDWIWDTYRAAHPLRLLLDPSTEEAIIASYLRMATQTEHLWMPTFPEVTGDSRRMNSNHAVATVADALAKGLKVDTATAYEACRRGIEEKTLAPWSGQPAGWIDAFYREHGYIPALRPGEAETDPHVHPFEQRQPVAVTLGTSYDHWCLSQIASALGKSHEAARYRRCALNYRNLFRADSGFFHPKDKEGRWIEPFDYRYSGGMGARAYYGENNGWVYRWDVPHNVADLVRLMGGRSKFIRNLDQTFSEPLGRSKFEFFAQLPDHTGNVGQFSMANEPSLHVPYLYNYAGQPWKTQKRIRQMLHTWFRNDLMGVPGDEDGGGMTSFVVFSSLGFYPVTPGIPAYNIGSPLFTRARITLSNGCVFEIVAQGASHDNKYIQSAVLNGRPWNKPWFTHKDIKNGGTLILQMGCRPNKAWGSAASAVPPSMDDALE